MLDAILKYEFMQNALVAGLLASLLCAVVGVIVVEKKLVMMSGGIAHTAYGGVGLGYLIGIEPVVGAFGFALASAVGMGFIKRKGSFKSDVVIGLFWSLGMAMGILFISLMEGYPPDLNMYLFGNILSVTKGDLYLITGVAVIVFAAIGIFFNYWKAYLFDDKFAEIKGIRVALLDYALFVLIAISVVALIRVIGIILVIALLTAPAALASLLTTSLKKRMLISGIAGVLFCTSGLWISYELNISSGASIVIVSVLAYVLTWSAKMISGARRRSNA